MNSSLAYSEVYEILNLLEDEYKNRVPKKVIEFFERERDEKYNPIIEIDVPLDKQNLKRETMVLLAILNMNYWCDNEDEKQEMLKSFNENEVSKKLIKSYDVLNKVINIVDSMIFVLDENFNIVRINETFF